MGFLETQHNYALKAKDSDELSIPDTNGRLLLHSAIDSDDLASLGAIKLIAKGYPAALSAPFDGLLPIQMATGSKIAGLVKCLVELEGSSIELEDMSGNNLLHLACQNGNCGAVKYLLEKCAPLASSENKEGMLPVHLLSDCSGKDEAVLESKEYTETTKQRQRIA